MFLFKKVAKLRKKLVNFFIIGSHQVAGFLLQLFIRVTEEKVRLFLTKYPFFQNVSAKVVCFVGRCDIKCQLHKLLVEVCPVTFFQVLCQLSVFERLVINFVFLSISFTKFHMYYVLSIFSDPRWVFGSWYVYADIEGHKMNIAWRNPWLNLLQENRFSISLIFIIEPTICDWIQRLFGRGLNAVRDWKAWNKLCSVWLWFF